MLAKTANSNILLLATGLKSLEREPQVTGRKPYSNTTVLHITTDWN